ncbi:hypothetical protein A9Q87_02735 [Flavobacteriales bacterium 34_180_T64]|nr:hypothetical protein A9Q87_02735 [Flavobacteriales bacterium 34_180_T64]
MHKQISFLICSLLFTISTFSQTINDIINQVNLDSLQLTLREITGEQSTVVYGVTKTIINRQQANNEDAADYIKQKFEGLDNVTVTDQAFNANGRNIIATQIGKTNPDDIYLICAHYDSVTDYCADDNASGTAAVLEIARILSKQCLDNTIVYALWDEEENGLNGSRFYAIEAVTNGDNLLGVLNIDMMGYDGDNDDGFDIDVRQGDASSIAMGTDIVDILNHPNYSFNLNVNVVNPGTSASDHSSFWNRGFPAVLVGESWENNDQTPFYHSSGDRYSTLDFPYYHELARLIMGYMVTKGGLVAVDNSVSQTATTLTANQASASYQWLDCNTNIPIPLETNQSFMPSFDGVYAVEITSGSCIELSDCIVFDTLGLDAFLPNEIQVYPNPVKTILNIEAATDDDYIFNIYDVSGKLVLSVQSQKRRTTLNIKTLSKGIYFLNVNTKEKLGTYKIVKE